jgi:hypothetical protein
MRKSVVSAMILAGVLTLRAGAGSASQVAYAGPSLNDPDPAGLEEEARSLFSNPKKYGEAVKLFLRAAEMRQPGDRVRLNDLVMAARLTFYRGDAEKARMIMERAADEALAYGDVVTAAHTYVDAAFLAQDAKDAVSVVRLTTKAKQLSNSPLLAQQERNNIVSRLPVGV